MVTFPLAPPTDQSFHLFNEISQDPLNEWAQSFSVVHFPGSGLSVQGLPFDLSLSSRVFTRVDAAAILPLQM